MLVGAAVQIQRVCNRDIPDLPRPLRVCTSGRRLLIQKNRPAKKIFPCLFDRFDKISLRERALTNV